MGDLTVLYSLNLSNNYLNGHIPKSFQKLEQLESLDLSHNKFDGNIPPQLIELTFLSTFNVAFNHLFGRIPYENNFATFKENSYIGNQELCGPPLDVNCSLSDKPSSQPHQNGNGEFQTPLIITKFQLPYSYFNSLDHIIFFPTSLPNN
uniref:Receptor-like protein 2 n=1 Tax=Nelumbo nucifera TaxID=4432 RepID=A0A822XQF5_NELNU|nr:TPA_asm: hypothetical protein HUJ06_024123 [Nelumbo nucifera]